MHERVPAHPINRKLESIFALSPEERSAIADLPLHVRQFDAGQDVSREQDRPSQCCVVLEGLACRYKILRGGRRQIFSFHIPGDIPDLQSLHIEVMDHNLATIVPSKVGFIPHHVMRTFLRAHPRISDVFWRDTLIEAAIFREWIANVGGRAARPRMAHIICEMFVRLRATGAIAADTYELPLPITQTELGHALGLSLVHVNRTLQSLRKDELISHNRSSIFIKDWPGLQAAGEFDPTYLHLRENALNASAASDPI
jgi:CRP-like cAMP-binding protein